MAEQYEPADLERYRKELTGYCYRMLGSAFEAEDAVQDTMVRAWKGLDKFEGRATLRSWLYRIATNVCLEALGGRGRRARPMDLSGPATADALLAAPAAESTWVGPIPDARVGSEEGDPAERAVVRESVRLAFVAALQHLPPRQRAVLILREVLKWRAAEVAELLDSSVASVNSALQRARAALDGGATVLDDPARPLDDEQRDLLTRYLVAFEAYDMEALTTLLHQDATMSMPPYELWLRGAEEITAWMTGPGAGCRGSRLVPVVANGAPAFAHYRPDGEGGHVPWGLVVLDIAGGRIAALNYFLEPDAVEIIETRMAGMFDRLPSGNRPQASFPLFGLPPRLAPD